jgi:hypothetical protein
MRYNRDPLGYPNILAMHQLGVIKYKSITRTSFAQFLFNKVIFNQHAVGIPVYNKGCSYTS